MAKNQRHSNTPKYLIKLLYMLFIRPKILNFCTIIGPRDPKSDKGTLHKFGFADLEIRHLKMAHHGTPNIMMLKFH